MRIPPSSSSSSPSSSSSIHSTISTQSLSSSSSSSSSSTLTTTTTTTTTTPSRRCQGLDLLVKAAYHVAGSVIGVPYIQRRLIRRRKPAMRFQNPLDHVDSQLLVVVDEKCKKKKPTRRRSNFRHQHSLKSKDGRKSRSNLVQPTPTKDLTVVMMLFSLSRRERTYPEDPLSVVSEGDEVAEDTDFEGEPQLAVERDQEKPPMSSDQFSFSLDSVMEKRKRKLTPSSSQPDPKKAAGVCNRKVVAPVPPLVSVHHRPSILNATTLLRFPRGYGGSLDGPMWPQLEQLLLPGPAHLLASKPLSKLLNNATESDFVNLQRSLFFKKEVSRLMGEVNNLKELNSSLESQLSASMNEKKVAQDQLGRNQSVKCSLSAGLKAAEDQVLALKRLLLDSFLYATWESKIQRIKEFQAGKILDWNLEEEERQFAEAFPSKPDLSILGDMEIYDDEEEAICFEGPNAGEVASASGTAPAKRDLQQCSC